MTKYQVRILEGECGYYSSYEYGTYDTLEQAQEVAHEQACLTGCNAYVEEIEIKKSERSSYFLDKDMEQICKGG